jgi:hypothetical protein
MSVPTRDISEWTDTLPSPHCHPVVAQRHQAMTQLADQRSVQWHATHTVVAIARELRTSASTEAAAKLLHAALRSDCCCVAPLHSTSNTVATCQIRLLMHVAGPGELNSCRQWPRKFLPDEHTDAAGSTTRSPLHRCWFLRGLPQVFAAVKHVTRR